MWRVTLRPVAAAEVQSDIGHAACHDLLVQAHQIRLHALDAGAGRS